MGKEILKKLTNFSKIICICCCFFLTSCVSAIYSGANAAYNHNAIKHKASDYIIAFRITNAILNDSNLSAQTAISVTSFNQIVLLTGQATTAQFKQQVANIAGNTADVLRVYNAVTVENPMTASNVAMDTWLTTKIKTKLIASNDIDPSKIKVVTENQVVYLMGIVPKDQADIAVDIASNTAGVEHVVKIFYYVIMPKIN